MSRSLYVESDIGHTKCGPHFVSLSAFRFIIEAKLPGRKRCTKVLMALFWGTTPTWRRERDPWCMHSSLSWFCFGWPTDLEPCFVVNLHLLWWYWNWSWFDFYWSCRDGCSGNSDNCKIMKEWEDFNSFDWEVHSRKRIWVHTPCTCPVCTHVFGICFGFHKDDPSRLFFFKICCLWYLQNINLFGYR